LSGKSVGEMEPSEHGQPPATTISFGAAPSIAIFSHDTYGSKLGADEIAQEKRHYPSFSKDCRIACNTESSTAFCPFTKRL
jgi:hypothetical protein